MVYVLAMPELFYTIQMIYNRTQEVIPLLDGGCGVVSGDHQRPVVNSAPGGTRAGTQRATFSDRTQPG